jgi:hypothetical protein
MIVTASNHSAHASGERKNVSPDPREMSRSQMVELAAPRLPLGHKIHSPSMLERKIYPSFEANPATETLESNTFPCGGKHAGQGTERVKENDEPGLFIIRGRGSVQ